MIAAYLSLTATLMIFRYQAVLLFMTLLVGVAPSYVIAVPPNLLMVIADDCTYHDIGCYGGQAHTPNIDRLAEQGIRMSHCFQCAPMCSPTRHNIYTGLYPVKTGAYPNHTFTYDHIRNVTDLLAPLGYRIALSGKRHVAPKARFRFEYSGKKNPDMRAIDRLLAESARDQTPFCLFACSNEPHEPWDQGDPNRYELEQLKLPPYLADTPQIRDGFRRYLAEITFFDDQVGQLIRLLDKHGLASNTFVIVVSEQGNSMPMAKWTCYDNGLRSAMVCRWPGHIAPGSVSNAMVEYVDILPTLLDVAGDETDREFDGRSFLDVLTGKATQHKEYVYGLMTTNGINNGNHCFPIRSIRSASHKLIWNLKPDQPFRNACTESVEFRSLVRAANSGNQAARHVVERYQHRPSIELYDTSLDPYELNNLADDPAVAELVVKLKDKLEQWMHSQGDEGILTELAATDRQTPKRRQRKAAAKNQ